MGNWTITGEPKRYEGSSHPSADVDFGYKFTLRGEAGGDDRVMNVEHIVGADDLPESRAREAASRYLTEDTPPRHVQFARDGQFYPPPKPASS